MYLTFRDFTLLIQWLKQLEGRLGAFLCLSSFILIVAPSGVHTDPLHCFMTLHEAQNSLGTDYIDYSS